MPLNSFWRGLLRIPWTERRSNQSILKEISPEYSLKGLTLKLKLHTWATWCKEVTHWKRPWCWERLKAGGEGDNREWAGWMVSLTQWTWVWVSSGSWWRTGKPGMLQSMGSQRVGHDWVTGLNFLWETYKFHEWKFCIVTVWPMLAPIKSYKTLFKVNQWSCRICF